MKTMTKHREKPIQQFDQFEISGVNLGVDGVILASTPTGFLVWCPGHPSWEPKSRRTYTPVKLLWIYKTASEHWLCPKIAEGGRFNTDRFKKLLTEIQKRMGVDIQVEDIDVSRRKFTTIFG